MTDNLLEAFRNLHTSTQQAEVTMTAVQMALTSHNLNKHGEIATLPNGDKYYWFEARNLWIKAS